MFLNIIPKFRAKHLKMVTSVIDSFFFKFKHLLISEKDATLGGAQVRLSHLSHLHSRPGLPHYHASHQDYKDKNTKLMLLWSHSILTQNNSRWYLIGKSYCDLLAIFRLFPHSFHFTCEHGQSPLQS